MKMCVRVLAPKIHQYDVMGAQLYEELFDKPSFEQMQQPFQKSSKYDLDLVKVAEEFSKLLAALQTLTHNAANHDTSQLTRM